MRFSAKTYLAPVACLTLVACSSLPPSGPFAALPQQSSTAATETIYVLTSDNTLLKVNAGLPQGPTQTLKITGLAYGETLLGIDFRVAYGTLYSVSNLGQVYQIDTATGQLIAVGRPTGQVKLSATHYGFDFNPAADRIRLVSDDGVNMRLHPDTGAFIDNDATNEGIQLDGALRYHDQDPYANNHANLVAAGYTYNTKNPKLTTNYAIDANKGTLVTQGTHEMLTPATSPNTGLLFTVGNLGTGPLNNAHLDISDVHNTAYAALQAQQNQAFALVRIDLSTGAATHIGQVADGQAVVGLAIEP